MITLFIDNSQSNNKIVNITGNKVTYYYKPSIVLDENKKYEIRLVSMSIEHKPAGPPGTLWRCSACCREARRCCAPEPRSSRSAPGTRRGCKSARLRGLPQWQHRGRRRSRGASAQPTPRRSQCLLSAHQRPARYPKMMVLMNSFGSKNISTKDWAGFGKGVLPMSHPRPRAPPRPSGRLAKKSEVLMLGVSIPHDQARGHRRSH